MEVVFSEEKVRGCGFRKSGKDGVGQYMMGGKLEEPCERLPMPLTVCPCCGQGYKFARNFTWIDPGRMFAPDLEPRCLALGEEFDRTHAHAWCSMCCPADVAGDRAGLIWIGARHYKTPALFLAEAREMGISRRLPAIPNKFEFGEHYVYLAHKAAVIPFLGDFEIGKDEPPKLTPGVFSVFKPTHVDLVIDDEDNIPEKAVRLMEKHGENARLVKVERVE